VVCPTCDVNDPECPHCPDCEKHPADIHTTPPNLYLYSYPIKDPWLSRALLEERVEYLEEEMRQIKARLGL